MLKIITVLCSAFGFTIVGVICIAGLIVALASPKLPQVSELVDYTPKLPLRIMTADGILIGEFGEEKRKVVEYKNTPKVLIDAILAAEEGPTDLARQLSFILAKDLIRLILQRQLC